jgi:hypothetical protein
VIEVVDLALPPAEVKTIDVTTSTLGTFGGRRGDAPARADEPSRARTNEPKRTIVASRTITPRAPDRAGTVAPRANPTAATSDAFDDPRGAITFDDPRTGDDAGLGSGGSGGTGNGRGSGIGFGDGGGISAGAPPPPPPPAPKLSKARPARLIFPSRQRDVDDGELYVMRVTVDADGFVAGATLVRGFGGRRDEVASAQIWRFRYDPARDDDGTPVRSVLEQRFLVQ